MRILLCCVAVTFLAACEFPTQPKETTSLTFSSVSPGAYHTCGVSTDGVAYCWGSNGDGELGTGGKGNPVLQPIAVSDGLRFTMVSSGYARTCGISTDGATYCWGRGYGARPKAISSPEFVSIDAGRSDENTCGLTAHGQAYCWGSNQYGQTGNGTVQPTTSPSRVALDGAAQVVTTGAAHACAVDANGSAYCWGVDAQGRLGTVSIPSACAEIPCRSPTPTRVLGGAMFTAVSAGYVHTCGLTSDKAVYCWGGGLNGELGSTPAMVCHPQVPCSPVPTRVSGERTYATVGSGAYHTCAVTTEGNAFCWGLNDAGQLGIGSRANSASPSRVGGNVRFRSTHPGIYHTCGVTTDGQAFCWGGNNAGALGNGTTEHSAVPVAVLRPVAS